MSAKEGSRTLTGVTPLEPEGIESSGKRLTKRNVRPVRWVKVRPQNAAGNRKVGRNSGACTEIAAANSDPPKRALYWPHVEPGAWS